MTDIRSKASKVKLPPVDFYYTVFKDLYGSFDIEVKWEYDTDFFKNDIKEFRVYKAVLNYPKLSKKYSIDQDGLEVLTGGSGKNLYNKSLISQNSQVFVKNSNSDQHRKNESTQKYSFFNISRIKSNKKQKKYRFLDKNVKFGESYSYYVTAVSKTNQESSPKQVIASVEWPINPDPPVFFDVSEVFSGILLKIGNKENIFVSKFLIYRREDSEKDFVKIGEVQNRSDCVSFIDRTCLPKKNYIYKAYCVDIFGNISLSSLKKEIVFRTFPLTTNIEYRPSFQIRGVNNSYFEFEIFNNRPDKINSIKIERRDDWKFERKFEIKKYNDLYWPTSMLFNSEQKIIFEDRDVSIDRAYSYRITAYNQKGQVVSYTITPPIKIDDRISSLNDQAPKFDFPKFDMFNMEIISSGQDPVLVKFDWKISGDWGFLNIKTSDFTVEVDNIHESVVLNKFQAKKKYDISIELFDINSRKVGEITRLMIKT